MMEFLRKVRSPKEIISAAVGIVRRKWDVMLAVLLPVFLPLLALRWVTTGQLSQLLSYALGLVPPVAAAIAAVVVDEAPNGGVSVSRVLDRLRGRWGAIIAVAFIQSVITAVGFAMLIVPGLILTAVLVTTPAVVVLERENDTFSSFNRARELAKGEWWHIWATLFWAWAIWAFVCLLLWTLAQPLVMVLGIKGPGLRFLYGAAYTALQAFIGVVNAMLYFDLRARRTLAQSGRSIPLPSTFTSPDRSTNVQDSRTPVP
jgi:hypothetical protein